MVDNELLHRLGYDDLRSAGRDLIALEIMGAIGACSEKIEKLKAEYGSFQDLEQQYHAEGKEDFDLDDHYLAWRAAREQLGYWQEQLQKLEADAA
jgi:hypothetical protein